jgi:hypothetical protein
MPSRRRPPRTIKKKTRQSPLPIAFYDLSIPDEIWNKAEKEGQPRCDKYSHIKHTEGLRDQVSAVLGRLKVELKQHQNLPSEGLMRTKLGRIEKVLAICVPVLADLSENNSTNELIRRTTIKYLRKDLANYRKRAEPLLVRFREQEIEQIRTLLLQESATKAMRTSADIVFSAFKLALEQSDAPTGPGIEGSPLANRLRDLAWCYRQAGGRVHNERAAI